MDTSRIGKIEKAKRYAQEPERFQFKSFVITVQGDNDSHIIRYKDGKFESDSPYFQTHGYSAHTIALEHILKGMITPPTQGETPYINDSGRIGKVEKAKRYAQERERFQFEAFEVVVQGDNDTHHVFYQDGKFDSDSPFFQAHGYSAHSMALERILKGMIPSPSEEME